MAVSLGRIARVKGRGQRPRLHPCALAGVWEAGAVSLGIFKMRIKIAGRVGAGPIMGMPEPEPTEKKEKVVVAIDRSQWPRPWAQLKYFTFQPAIFPRLLGQVSPDARPGDFVNVYDKNGNLAGGGLYNPRAKIPLRVVTHSTEPVKEDYFEGALRRAVELRRTMFKLDE